MRVWQYELHYSVSGWGFKVSGLWCRGKGGGMGMQVERRNKKGGCHATAGNLTNQEGTCGRHNNRQTRGPNSVPQEWSAAGEGVRRAGR